MLFAQVACCFAFTLPVAEFNISRTCNHSLLNALLSWERLSAGQIQRRNVRARSRIRPIQLPRCQLNFNSSSFVLMLLSSGHKHRCRRVCRRNPRGVTRSTSEQLCCFAFWAAPAEFRQKFPAAQRLEVLFGITKESFRVRTKRSKVTRHPRNWRTPKKPPGCGGLRVKQAHHQVDCWTSLWPCRSLLFALFRIHLLCVCNLEKVN